MILIIPLLILRLFMQKIFPQYGPGMILDAIFGVWCAVGIAFYYLIKTKTPFTTFLFFWLAAATLSCITTVNPTTSFINLFILTIYIITFCSIKNRLKPEEVTITWALMFGLAVICAAIGLKEAFFMHTGLTPKPTTGMAAQILYAAKRATSLQGWPTAFGGYLILFIPTAFIFLLEKRTWFRALLTLILIGGLLSSWSITPVLSLGIAFLLTFYRKEEVYTSLLLTVAACFIIFQTKTTSFMTARLEYYTEALTMIAHHPILGNGWATFVSHGFSKSIYAHNSYLQVWAETGPLGFIGVMGLFIVFWHMRPSRNEPLQLAMYIGLLAVFIDNFFNFTMLKPSLSFVWWMSLALYAALWKGKIQWT